MSEWQTRRLKRGFHQSQRTQESTISEAVCPQFAMQVFYGLSGHKGDSALMSLKCVYYRLAAEHDFKVPSRNRPIARLLGGGGSTLRPEHQATRNLS